MKMNGYIKKNWFFLVLLLGIIIVFVKRYSYLDTAIVSNPDSQIVYNTEDDVLEQTWLPIVKMISGIKIPYYAENSFSCDVQLRVYNDDYSKVLVEAVQTKYNFSEGESGNIEFEFKKIRVIQGERYRIQVSLLNASETGTLRIASGSNYAGCSVAGEEEGQAAALTIISMKYSKIFWLVAVMFPLLAFSTLMMILTGKKWEETVGLSLFMEGIILYCFGLTEHLVWGVETVYVLAFCAMLAAVYFYNKREMELRDLLSPGLWIFIILFGVILVTGNNDYLSVRDELRHWGIAVQDMFYYDSFAKHANSTVILTRYLPFTALIEYLFQFVNGIFSEGILFVAYQTMLLCVSIILCKPLQKKGCNKLLIPIMVTMICVPVIFFNDISGNIMVDSLMAVIVAYVLICYYSEKMSWFNCIRIASALFALTLIKDMGLVLAGVTSFIIFGDVVFEQIREKKMNLKKLFYPIMCVGLILVVFFSWQIYLSYSKPDSNTNRQQENVAEEVSEVVGKNDDMTEENNEVVEESDDATVISASGVTLEGLKNILTGQGEEYQYQITHNFLIELFDGKTYSFGSLTVSFADILLSIAFLMISLGYFGYWQEDKAEIYVYSGMFILASLCLCIFLQIMYWFTFEMYEAMELTSFSRYLAPYICAIIMTSLYLIIDGIDNSKEMKFKVQYLIYTLVFGLFISMPVSGILEENKKLEGNTMETLSYGHDEIAEILRSTANRGERVYFVCSNSDGYSEYIFRNTICPIVSEHEYWNIVSTKEIYQEQYEIYNEDEITVHNTASVISVSEWEEMLTDCKYLVVFHADELFKKSYKEVFEGLDITDGSIYQIINKQGNIKLQLIGGVGIKGYR